MNELVEPKQTYSMEFTCQNCGHKVERKIPKGEKALGYGGDCPYCGCLIGHGGSPRKPYWLQQAEMLRNAFSKEG